VPLPLGKGLEFLQANSWEYNFMKRMTLDKTIKLLETANFLDVPALFELCCAVIAAEFRGKSFDECKKTFGLENEEYGPKEEEQIKKEHPWIYEST
jgi:hypothetical protein